MHRQHSIIHPPRQTHLILRIPLRRIPPLLTIWEVFGRRLNKLVLALLPFDQYDDEDYGEDDTTSHPSNNNHLNHRLLIHNPLLANIPLHRQHLTPQPTHLHRHPLHLPHLPSLHIPPHHLPHQSIRLVPF